MRMLTGVVFLVLAEQAFAHAHLIGFPHQEYASQFLIPASVVGLALGVGCLIWGFFTERGSSAANKPVDSKTQPAKRT